MEKCNATILSALSECDSHLQKLDRGLTLLGEFFPLDVDKFAGCSEWQIEHIDQFIYRFTKLQDSMGTRLLPALYARLEGTEKPVPFIDVLSKLEKLEVLSSGEDWQFFRNLRNNLAHDYPESREQNVLTLNLLFDEFPRMLQMYVQVRNYAKKRVENGDLC